MHALVFGKARGAAPARTLLARAGGVFMWPGIALTERRGAACVPIAADAARFWISRLHGPEAIDSAFLRCLAIAAQKLSDGDETGAQQALDASGLTRLSGDGAVLMHAVAGSLGSARSICPGRKGQGCGARRLSKRICLCSKTTRRRRLCSRRRGLGTNRNIRAGPPGRPTIKAGVLTMAKAGRSARAGPSHRAMATTASSRLKSPRKDR
jgi:hypothetical protein